MNRFQMNKWHIFLALGLALLLAGCGGGGGGGGNNSTSGSANIPAPGTAASPTSTLAGVAATGAPVAGVVTLKDSSAVPQILTTATASDGSYSFNVAPLQAPFVLRTTYVDAGGSHALYSLSSDAGTANITPLTTIALREAASGADLALFFDNNRAAEIKAAAAKMPASVATLQNALAPLMQRFGVQGNLLTTPFTADHTGVDAMLDAITVPLTGGSVSILNKASGALLFSAPANNLGAGSFITANLLAAPTAVPPSGGSLLYAAQCAGCHGDLANTSLAGVASVAAIQNAISTNLGGMKMLSSLAPADIQAISDAILGVGATPAPATPPTPPAPAAPPAPPVPGAQTDGATLYAASCAGCHGALGSSSKRGVTVVRIQNAISGNVGGMGKLTTLSAADMQAIATALAATPATPTPAPTPTTPAPPTTTPDGAALYSSKCASCHGALANSGKSGISIARLQGAIAGNTGGMGSLSTLTVSEVQAIVTALTPTTPTPTPTAAACGSCHPIPPGSGHHGEHRNRSASNIGWNAPARTCANACHGRETW
ncbi:MAG: cytochrome c [Proteobacteria bacterium]|nr:cytochrome c [Pseudomonadota bacterium]